MMNGKFKWLLVALCLSLAANIFVAGMLIGKEFKGHKVRKGKPPVVDFNMRRVGKLLSDEDQAAIREILRAERQELRQHFSDIKASEEAIKAALVAESVDKVALKAAIEAHADRLRGMHKPIRRIVLEVIAELDQETRIKVADEMFQRRKFGRDRHFGSPHRGREMPQPLPEDEGQDGDLLPPPPEGGDENG